MPQEQDLLLWTMQPEQGGMLRCGRLSGTGRLTILGVDDDDPSVEVLGWCAIEASPPNLSKGMPILEALATANAHKKVGSYLPLPISLSVDVGMARKNTHCPSCEIGPKDEIVFEAFLQTMTLLEHSVHEEGGHTQRVYDAGGQRLYVDTFAEGYQLHGIERGGSKKWLKPLSRVLKTLRNLSAE